MPPLRVNVADRLAAVAVQMPDAIAVARPGRGDVAGRNSYATCTFGELDADATALARALVDRGVAPGMRLVLLVPPGIEFVKLVFALLRSGATTVLVDPGMGRKHLVNCLAAAEPDGFVAVSRAQAVRALLRRRFPRARLNVTVGRRWFWGGATYRQLLRRSANGDSRMKATGSAGGLRSQRCPIGGSPPTEPVALIPTHADDPAAIIFTSGSTGPPKGVLYTHRMFETQVSEIQRQYNLHPGGADLACFALFGLFNSAMGVTTVFPHMDFSRPASADPQKLLAAANDWRVTQAFASPAVWDKLSRHCEQTGERIPTLRKVFSCGAPVPAEVLGRTLNHVAASGAEMHTPYGATEALPVSTIEAREVLGETAALTSKGAGVCVGHKFDSIDWRVIRITDGPIVSLDDAEELPAGEIGELIVRGPQVSPHYISFPAPSPLRGGLGRGAAPGTRTLPPSLTLPSEGRGPEELDDPNALGKIPDSQSATRNSQLATPPAPWHRMGDVGYLDHAGRFWYCGRKSHRVETGPSSCFSVPYEEVFNAHPRVKRSALVGCGPFGAAQPVLIVELTDDDPARNSVRPDDQLFAELEQLKETHLAHDPAQRLVKFAYVLVHPNLPVDVRHNAKINREALAAWALRTIADHKLRPIPGNHHVLPLRPPASSLQPPA